MIPAETIDPTDRPGATDLPGATGPAAGRRPWQAPDLVHLPAGKTRLSDAGASEDSFGGFEAS